MTGPKGADGTPGTSVTMTPQIGQNGVDGTNGANGTDGMTRIIYTDPNNTPHEVATLDDGIKYTGDTGSAYTKLNKVTNIVGGNKGPLTDGNIGVEATQTGDNATLTIKLAKDLVGLNSVTTVDAAGNTNVMNGAGNTYTNVVGDTNVVNAGGMTITNAANPTNPISITTNNISMGGNQIHNVAAGTAPTDAVNVSQLDAKVAGATTKVVAGNNTTVNSATNPDGSTTYTVGLQDKITLGNNPKTAVTVDGTAGTITAGTGAQAVKVDGTTGTVQAGNVTVNGQAGTVNGLTNTTWDPNNYVSGQAATEDQLKAINNIINNLHSNQPTVTEGQNIKVATVAGFEPGTSVNYIVSTSDDLVAKTIKLDDGNGNATYINGGTTTVTNAKGDTTTVNANGVTISNGNNPVSITNTGLNNGGNRITNVADGINDNDAATVGQLKEISTEGAVKYEPGCSRCI